MHRLIYTQSVIRLAAIIAVLVATADGNLESCSYEHESL